MNPLSPNSIAYNDYHFICTDVKRFSCAHLSYFWWQHVWWLFSSLKQIYCYNINELLTFLEKETYLPLFFLLLGIRWKSWNTRSSRAKGTKISQLISKELIIKYRNFLQLEPHTNRSLLLHRVSEDCQGSTVLQVTEAHQGWEFLAEQ